MAVRFGVRMWLSQTLWMNPLLDSRTEALVGREVAFVPCFSLATASVSLATWPTTGSCGLAPSNALVRVPYATLRASLLR